jgi:hypothetical protein
LPPRYPLTGFATKGRAIKIKFFTLPGSDAEQAADSNRNGMNRNVFFHGFSIHYKERCKMKKEMES